MKETAEEEKKQTIREGTPQLGPFDQSEAEKSIREMQDVFLKGLLTSDPKLRASIWSEDGTLVPPQGGFCRGRAEVEEYFYSEDASSAPFTKASFSNYRFSFVNSQTAFVEADLTLNKVETGDGHSLETWLVSVSFVAVKWGDKWWVQDERATFQPMAAGAE